MIYFPVKIQNVLQEVRNTRSHCVNVMCVLSRQRVVGAVGGRLHHSALQPDHHRRTAQRFVSNTLIHWWYASKPPEGSINNRVLLHSALTSPGRHVYGDYILNRLSPKMEIQSPNHFWLNTRKLLRHSGALSSTLMLISSFILKADIKQRRDFYS